jgi:sugar lactone lactonase YvrE
MLNFEQRIDFDLAVGESPVWDATRSGLWFIDALAPALFLLEVSTGQIERWPMPSPIGSVGLAKNGCLVIALKSGVHLFDPIHDKLEFLVHPEPDHPTNRLNDGKIGPDGCFWIGSMHDAFPRLPTAALYRVTPEGHFTKVMEGLRNSNGLAWSPDGRTMYHADTREPSISAYDFNTTTGAISNRRLLAAPSEREGLPDGAAVDVEGHYWSAGITAGCLNQLSANGEILARHPLPAPAPTMPCFGGADMRTLFVTSLTCNHHGQQVGGTLHSCEMIVPGLRTGTFGHVE